MKDPSLSGPLSAELAKLDTDPNLEKAADELARVVPPARASASDGLWYMGGASWLRGPCPGHPHRRSVPSLGPEPDPSTIPKRPRIGPFRAPNQTVSGSFSESSPPPLRHVGSNWW